MMSFENLGKKEALLTLNGLSKLGPISTRRLLERFDGCPLRILNASRSSLLSVRGVGNAMVESIKSPLNQRWVEQEVRNIRKHQASFIVEDQIPEPLRQLYDCPIGLYQKGTIPPGPYVSVVGTRVPSAYAQTACREISTELAKIGFCIVSGMARGIDGIAHESALNAGGKTIAFLGSGIDVIYPPEHLHLYRRISEQGAVLSEFPIGRKADRGTFPMRNRLVSGISSGVVVIESGITGGSMITARLAAEQGRLVFAVPGRIDQSSSRGSHKLIREGATLIANAQEILEDLQPLIIDSFGSPSGNRTKSAQGENPLSMDKLSKQEKAVLSILDERSLLSIEEISTLVDLEIQEISTALSMLELERRACKRPDGKYEILISGSK